MLKQRQEQSGFTLIELLVTLAIAVILVTIGIPGFQHLVAENQREANAAAIHMATRQARSQAITRNMPVVICARSIKQMATPKSEECNNTNNYKNGWLIFANTDLNQSGISSNDHLISVHGPIKGDFTLKLMTEEGSSTKRLVYQPDGGLKSTENLQFELCPQSKHAAGQIIRVPKIGNPKRINESNCS